MSNWEPTLMKKALSGVSRFPTHAAAAAWCFVTVVANLRSKAPGSIQVSNSASLRRELEADEVRVLRQFSESLTYVAVGY